MPVPVKPPPCRWCGEKRLVEWTEDGRYVFCNVCGKAQPAPAPVKRPTARGAL